MANETPPSSGASGRAKMAGDEAIAKMAQAQQMADLFASKAANATGVASKQLDNMADIYQKMAKNSSQIKKYSEEIAESEKKRLKIADEIAKLTKEDAEKNKDLIAIKKKEVDILKEQTLEKEKNLRVSRRQVEAQEDLVKQVTNTDTGFTKLFKSQTAKSLAWIASTERLVQGVKGVAQAYRDVVDISISSGSFIGMTGNLTKDTYTLTKAAASYSLNLTDVAFQMGRLGISTEEGTAAYKEYAKVTGAGSGFKDQAEGMKDLTVATGYLAKELNVSLGDATAFVTESTLKFGRTTGQTASTLQDLRNQEEKVNTEMGRTVIQGRDVAKVLFDIARESNSGAQEQDVLSKMIVKNMVALQGQGNSYEQSLKSATGYVKGLTTEAPDWARILAGQDLFKEIKAGSKNGGIGKALSSQLEAAKPGLTKQVQDIMSSTNTTDYDKQRQVQELLQDTSVGMDVMEKRMGDYIAHTGKNATQAVMAIYGITDPLEAKRRADQFMMNKASRVEAENFLKLTDKVASNQYGISVDEVKYYKKAENHADLKAMMDAKATTEIEKQAKIEQAIQDAAKAAHKKELEDELAIAKAKGDTHLEGILQKKLDNESDSDKRAKDIAAKEKTRLGGASLVTGGDVQGAWQAATQSTLGKIVLGTYGAYKGIKFLTKVPKIAKSMSNAIKNFGGGGEAAATEATSAAVPAAEAGTVATTAAEAGTVATTAAEAGVVAGTAGAATAGAGTAAVAGTGVAAAAETVAAGGLVAAAAIPLAILGAVASVGKAGYTWFKVAESARELSRNQQSTIDLQDAHSRFLAKHPEYNVATIANQPVSNLPGIPPLKGLPGAAGGNNTQGQGGVPNLLRLTGTPTGQTYIMNATFDLGQAVAYIQGLQGRYGTGSPTGK
jgi:hypothetical protein